MSNIAPHLDYSKRNRTVAWSAVTGVASPPRVVIPKATRVRSNGGCGEALVRCVIVVTTVRKPSKGLVFLWYHSVRWRVVLQQHGGGGSRMVVVVSAR